MHTQLGNPKGSPYNGIEIPIHELNALRADSVLQLQGCLPFYQPQRGGLFVAFYAN